MIRSRSSRRPAFTLVELISVIAIIAVLTAIAVGTYFRVRIAQEEAATETTLAKLQSQLDLQWRSVLDNSRDQWRAGNDTTIGFAKVMAGDSSTRGLAILTKFRLKQEFPQTFWEAIVWPQQMQATLIPTASGSIPIAVEAKPPKYYAVIMQNLPATTVPRDPSKMTADEQYLESAALLYMALTRARRGNANFSPNEHLGAHAVGKWRIQVGDKGESKDFDVFLDTWGQPIGFIRWPFGARGTDLNQPPQQQVNKNGLPIDPQDPERALFDAKWYSAIVPGLGITYGQLFSDTLRHPLDLTQQPLNLSPVVFSTGRDKKLGIAAAADDTAAGQLHYTPLTSEENDNIYSYRVKAGRGNN
jgi:prepilin-type N-terminal cleavage/methylation domain-containing protein